MPENVQCVCVVCTQPWAPEDFQNGMCPACRRQCEYCAMWVYEGDLDSNGECADCHICPDCGVRSWEHPSECWVEDDYDERRSLRFYYSHDFKPSPVFLTAKGEPPPKLFVGFELEFEHEGKTDSSKVVANCAYPWLYYKRDGSLKSGGELVTHPMSPTFIRGIVPEITQVLGGLRKLGCRSFTTNTCGMHVHLSRGAFTTLHLFRFMKLLYENPEQFLKISRRRKQALQTWATLWDPTGTSILKKVKDGAQSVRYEAVNLRNPHTVEIRIFRGTLHPPAVLGNIELCLALWAYTGDCSMRDTTWSKFLEWTMQQKGQYPYLVEALLNPLFFPPTV